MSFVTAYLDFNRTLHGIRKVENGTKLHTDAVDVLTKSLAELQETLKIGSSGSIHRIGKHRRVESVLCDVLLDSSLTAEQLRAAESAHGCEQRIRSAGRVRARRHTVTPFPPFGRSQCLGQCFFHQ